MEEDKHFKPLKMQDTGAEQQLIPILNRAVGQLSSLDAGIALVAESPDKFNDAYEDDYWRAAQVNETYWEQSHYFKGRTEPLFEEYGSYASAIRLETARKVLQELEALNWRDYAIRCLDGSGALLCLAIDHGQPLICRTSPVDGEGDAWTWSENFGLQHIATCERIDGRIGDPNPIGLDRLRPDVWNLLTPAARRHFNPAVRNGEAYTKFCKLLSEAERHVRELTSERALLVAPASRLFPGDEDRGGVAYVSAGDEGGVSKAVAPLPKPHSSRSDNEPLSPVLQELDSVLAGLENARWRDLFGTSMSPLQSGDLFSLLIDPHQTLLIWELSVFKLRGSTVKLCGLTDRMNCYDPDWSPSFHPVG